MSGAGSPLSARTAHLRTPTRRCMDPPRPGPLPPPRRRRLLPRRMHKHPPADKERPSTTIPRLSAAEVPSHKPSSATAGTTQEKRGARPPRAPLVAREQTPTSNGTGSAGRQGRERIHGLRGPHARRGSSQGPPPGSVSQALFNGECGPTGRQATSHGDRQPRTRDILSEKTNAQLYPTGRPIGTQIGRLAVRQIRKQTRDVLTANHPVYWNAVMITLGALR